MDISCALEGVSREACSVAKAGVNHLLAHGSSCPSRLCLLHCLYNEGVNKLNVTRPEVALNSVVCVQGQALFCETAQQALEWPMHYHEMCSLLLLTLTYSIIYGIVLRFLSQKKEFLSWKKIIINNIRFCYVEFNYLIHLQYKSSIFPLLEGGTRGTKMARI